MEPGDEDLWPLIADRRRARRPDREQHVRMTVKDLQDRGRRPPRRLQGLSRQQIVAAAVTVADAEGAESISMRRIARELNAGAMSLYWHVASKDELLDFMLDAVEGEQEVPELTGGWRADLRAMAVASRAALRRHEWVMDFIGGRPPLGPNTLRNMERALTAIDKLGLDLGTALNVLSTVTTYVMGAVQRELREIRVERLDEEQLGHLSTEERRDVLAAGFDRVRASGRFPHFVQIFDQGIDPDAAATRDSRFEFGLECVLDGIAARLTEP